MNNIYPPHIQRIIDEAEELNEKIKKLDAFIKDNPIFKEQSAIDQQLMKRQLTVMKEYLEILDMRLVF